MPDWRLLDIPEYPALRILEKRLRDRLVLLSFCTRTDRKLCYREFPGVVYDLWFTLAQVKECRMNFIEESLAKAAAADVPSVCGDTTLAKKYPALFQFLTLTLLESGVTRKTATLTVFYDDGAFKCFLNDRQSLKSLCVTSNTLNGLWEALESRITSSEPGWRPMTQRDDAKRPGPSKKKT